MKNTFTDLFWKVQNESLYIYLGKKHYCGEIIIIIAKKTVLVQNVNDIYIRASWLIKGSLSQQRNCTDITCWLCVVTDLRSSGIARFWVNWRNGRDTTGLIVLFVSVYCQTNKGARLGSELVQHFHSLKNENEKWKGADKPCIGHHFSAGQVSQCSITSSVS